jgi:hypothetical protein
MALLYWYTTMHVQQNIKFKYGVPFKMVMLNLCAYFEARPVYSCTIDTTTYVRLLWHILLMLVFEKFWYQLPEDRSETRVSYVNDSTQKL